jgi:F-type H+-transporting ATPase subunit delta
VIHGASRQSLAAVRERLNRVLAARSGDAQQSASVNRTLADELSSVANLLGGQPRLRRTLADPATDRELRGQLVRTLLAGKIGDEALDLTSAAASQRWSQPWDLADGLQTLAEDVLLVSAEQQGRLDDVEDELFRFERILADNGELVATLDEASVPADTRIDLVRTLLDGKVNPITFELVAHAITSGRKASLQLAIDDLLEASAVRRNRSVARVISAVELTDAQNDRLGVALSEIYGRPIAVRSAIDPAVQGGLEIRVGDELIDGTIASRIQAARAALAGK